jgi:hypothetical protein
MNENEPTDARLEFLRTDLDIAFTMLDVATTTGDEETAQRSRANARHAYYTVLRHLQNLSPDVAHEPRSYQEKVIYEKLGLLKDRLQLIGEQF